MTRHIIAIDPDVTKSGVAFLHLPSRDLRCEAKTFPELIDDLHAIKQATDALGEPLVVVVEAGWINHSNWHTKARENARTAAAKGRDTGRNHEVGRKIIEMARHMGIETVEQRPLRKCWQGADRKITAPELASITGYTRRTSQDMRDAALLAWVYAGLPVRIAAPRSTVLRPGSYAPIRAQVVRGLRPGELDVVEEVRSRSYPLTAF